MQIVSTAVGSSCQRSREIAIGAIFGDGEPALRLRKSAAAGPASLLSASITDGDELVGFAVYLSEGSSEEDLAEDIEVLRSKVRQLGGRCRVIEKRTVETSKNASALLVRTLLELQKQGWRADANED